MLSYRHIRQASQLRDRRVHPLISGGRPTCIAFTGFVLLIAGHLLEFPIHVRYPPGGTLPSDDQ
jgi:hypothetical protein